MNDVHPLSSGRVRSSCVMRLPALKERESFVHNLLVRIHFIIKMVRWTGLAPWEFEFPFPGSLVSTFLVALPLGTLTFQNAVASRTFCVCVCVIVCVCVRVSVCECVCECVCARPKA